jgi:hypothetical protein
VTEISFFVLKIAESRFLAACAAQRVLRDKLQQLFSATQANLW